MRLLNFTMRLLWRRWGRLLNWSSLRLLRSWLRYRLEIRNIQRSFCNIAQLFLHSFFFPLLHLQVVLYIPLLFLKEVALHGQLPCLPALPIQKILIWLTISVFLFLLPLPIVDLQLFFQRLLLSRKVLPSFYHIHQILPLCFH